MNPPPTFPMPDPRRRTAARALLAAASFACLPAWSADPPKAATPATPRTLRWDELVPKDWDPMKRFRDTGMGTLVDDSPQAQVLMRELREVWDNAPTVTTLDGERVRLPGYLVPLDEARDGLREFLLVPYFGACIHTPPPPANQIVHVLTGKQPAKGFRSMDPVWVTGTLRAARQASAMGNSGYRIEALSVERYVAPDKR